MKALVEPGPPLSAEQTERYARHLLLPAIGEIGQRRLLAARVCVLGAGGLGAPALAYLAAAGVGTIGIVDDDVVDTSNLQRQVIHGAADVGRAKVDSAAESIAALDPGIAVERHAVRLVPGNAAEILGAYDLVLDGTDNFETRYLVSDTCATLGLPVVWGSVLGFDAQVSVFWSRTDVGITLRDLFPHPPAPGTVPSCAEAGVLGALVGQMGSMMAAEAVKIILGVGQPLFGRVLVHDALAARWHEVPLRPARSTPPAVWFEKLPQIAPADLRDRLAARAQGADRFTLLDVREPHEVAAGAISGHHHVPLAEVLDGAEVPDDAPVIVYCARGPRAERAAAALRSRGYDVAILTGSYSAWTHP